LGLGEAGLRGYAATMSYSDKLPRSGGGGFGLGIGLSKSARLIALFTDKGKRHLPVSARRYSHMTRFVA
jgi:hypothetical protein